MKTIRWTYFQIFLIKFTTCWNTNSYYFAGYVCKFWRKLSIWNLLQHVSTVASIAIDNNGLLKQLKENYIHNRLHILLTLKIYYALMFKTAKQIQESCQLIQNNFESIKSQNILVLVLLNETADRILLHPHPQNIIHSTDDGTLYNRSSKKSHWRIYYDLGYYVVCTFLINKLSRVKQVWFSGTFKFLCCKNTNHELRMHDYLIAIATSLRTTAVMIQTES